MKKYIPVFIVAFLVVVIGAAIFYFVQDKQSADKPFGGAMNLITMNGDTFTEKDLRAKPAVIFFGFTHCPDVCPTTLYELDGYMKKLGDDASKLGVYFITVDPERDTQDIIQTYVSNVSPYITGLTGSPEAIADVVKSYHIYAKKVPGEDGDYNMDHTASVFLLDKGGFFKSTISYGENPDTAFQKLRNLADRH